MLLLQPYWGLDMRRNMEPAWDLHGQYSTDVFTKEAVRLIKDHNASQPLFLYFAHAAVHSANPYNPLPVGDEIVDKMKIPEYKRRRFAGESWQAFFKRFTFKIFLPVLFCFHVRFNYISSHDS